MDEVEEDMYNEVVKGAEAHTKIELTSHMSPVTLKIQSWPHSQTIQGKGSLRTRYAQKTWLYKKRRTTVSISSVKYNKNRLIAQIITWFKTQAEMNLDWQEE